MYVFFVFCEVLNPSFLVSTPPNVEYNCIIKGLLWDTALCKKYGGQTVGSD